MLGVQIFICRGSRFWTGNPLASLRTKAHRCLKGGRKRRGRGNGYNCGADSGGCDTIWPGNAALDATRSGLPMVQKAISRTNAMVREAFRMSDAGLVCIAKDGSNTGFDRQVAETALRGMRGLPIGEGRSGGGVGHCAPIHFHHGLPVRASSCSAIFFPGLRLPVTRSEA
jgi:hypothetical protein